MSTNMKKTIVDALQGFKNEYQGAQAKAAAINADPAYSPEGKEQKLAQVSTDLNTKAQKYRDTAISAVDAGIQGLKQKWGAGLAQHLTDAGYQIGLANTLEAIKSGSITRPEDAQAIIEVYKGDQIALSSLRNAFLKSGKETDKDFATLIPTDSRDRNIQLLEQLKENINRYIVADVRSGKGKAWGGFNQSNVGVVASMDGMSEFVNTSLNDDLSLI